MPEGKSHDRLEQIAYITGGDLELFRAFTNFQVFSLRIGKGRKRLAIGQRRCAANSGERGEKRELVSFQLHRLFGAW